MRLKSNGRLDPSDQYTSEWIGYPSGRAAETLTGNGAMVIGIYGHHGAALNTIGLVLRN
jgi:hypothetical protein